MQGQLAVEDAHKALVELLFAPNRIEDISALQSERKSGTDFLLHPKNHDGSFGPGIRCENKFEQMATGRQLFEIASVDRPTIVASWLYTSQAGWLLSWYPSAELVALPMDDARGLILKNPARHKTTTTRNTRYLTWNALEDINYVVQQLPNARVLDLRHELGMVPTEKRMLRGSSLDKQCSAEELVALMRTLAPVSRPVPVTQAELIASLRAMAPKNYRQAEHKDMLDKLAWLR